MNVVKQKILPVLGLTLALALVLTFLPFHTIVRADGNIIYVDKDATGTATGLSWTNAYTNVQDALSKANANGATDYEIWVAEGVYYPDEGADAIADSETMSFTLHYNNVQLYGGFAATEKLRSQRNWETNATILSGDLQQDDINTDGNNIAETWDDIEGNNADHILWLDGVTNENITDITVIDGFTITAGQVDNNGGGGLYCDGSSSGNACSPTIANVTFTGNCANQGAGMYNDGYRGDSSPTLTNVTFSGNRAGSSGGGTYNGGYYGNSSPTFTDVNFIDNRASLGGGVFNGGQSGDSSPTFINVIFSGNYASGSGGGGMRNYGFAGLSSPTLINVVFKGNQAKRGGGIYNDGRQWGESSPTFVNITFSGNYADYGGGMYNTGDYDGASTPKLTNCIFWGNGAITGTQVHNVSATPSYDHTLVQNSGGSGASWDVNLGTDEGNNLDVDPYFVMPITATKAPTTTGNYRLQTRSLAIDAGDNNAVSASTDLDGVSRTFGNAVDLGAYEATPKTRIVKTVTPTENVAYRGTVTYTIALSNVGVLSDTNVLFTDTLPSEVDFKSWVISPANTALVSDEIRWTGTITENRTLTWVFQATHTGDYSDRVANTAEFSGTLQKGSAEADFAVEPLLTMSKTVRPTTNMAYHGTATYTVVISNTGTVSDTNVFLTDTLPGEVDFASWVISPTNTTLANDQIQWTGAITAGETLTWVWTVTHIGGYGDIVTNTAKLSGTLQASDAKSTLAVERPFLKMYKTVTPTAKIAHHSTATYTVVISNTGMVSDTNVFLTDTLPAEIDFANWVVSPTNTTLTNDQIQWSGTVTAGESLTWTWTVVHTGNYASIVTNTAKFSGTLQAGCEEVIFIVEPPLLYVDADAAPGGDGLSWRSAYRYLQDALNRANARGYADYEIWVAEGVYYPDEGADTVADSGTMSFTFRYNNVQLYGGFAGGETVRELRDWKTNLTILSGDINANDWNTDTNKIAETWNDIVGENAHHVLWLDGVTNEKITNKTVIDGFTITAGQAGQHSQGGGLYCDGRGEESICGGSTESMCNPTLANLTFSGNSAGSGGGLYSGGIDGESSPLLTNVTFSGNHASIGHGGGMFNYGNSSPMLTNVVFSGNTNGDEGGGGMCNYGRNGKSNPTLINVAFIGNRTQWGYGGGMNSYRSSPTLINVAFINNRATHSQWHNRGGGGMYNYESYPTLINATFGGNRADYGGGIYNSNSSSKLTNCILWNNTAITGTQIHNVSATPVYSYTLVQGSGGSGAGWDAGLGIDGGNNLDINPRFLGPITATKAPTTAGDYRLQAGSPAIDIGDNDAVSVSTDLDGNPRIFDGTVDMGAYEATPHLVLAKTVTPTENVAYHSTVTYTIILSNTGVLSDTNVLFTDTLPSEVDFGSWIVSPPNTTLANDEIRWSGTVTTRDALTWTFQATHVGNYGDVVTNTVEFSSAWQTEDSNITFNVEPSPFPKLVLSKSVTPTVDVGYHDVVTYTIALSNSGIMSDTGVLLTDTLPAEMAFASWIVSPTNTVLINDEIQWAGTVTAGEAVTWIFQAAHIGNYSDIVTNTAELSGTLQAGASRAVFIVESSPPDLGINKTVTPTLAAPGDVITYTLSFSNTGSSTAMDVVITDTMPVSLTNTSFVSHGAAITQRFGTRCVWDVANLAHGDSGVITISGVISDPLPSVPFTNTATITTISTDSTPENNESTIAVKVQLPCTSLITAEIGGLAEGYVDTPYTFGAVITPTDATQPITYTWTPTPTGGQETDSVTYTWSTTGSKTITVTAENCDGVMVSDTHTITITAQPSCTPLVAVKVGGLAEGYVDTPYTFNAAITPTDATPPITYTWTPTPDRGQGTGSAIYAWSTEGTKTITVTAENCDGTVVSDTHDITLAAAESVSVTVNPDVSQTLTYTETDGVTTTVEIPAGAVSTATEIRFTSIPSPTAEITSGLHFGDHAFSLDAYREGQLLPDFTFTGTMTVTVHYREADVEGIDEETLALYRYGASHGWVELGEEPGEGQDLNVDDNVLRAWLRSFSRFGAYGAEAPTFQVYLPLVLRNR